MKATTIMFFTLTWGNKNVSFGVVLGMGCTPCSLLCGFSKQAGKSLFVLSWFPIFKNRDWLIFIFKFCQNLVTGWLSKSTSTLITSLKHICLFPQTPKINKVNNNNSNFKLEEKKNNNKKDTCTHRNIFARHI